MSAFARGQRARADGEASVAAMEDPWPDGQAEGRINRLKALMRHMCGRARLDLLHAGTIAA